MTKLTFLFCVVTSALAGDWSGAVEVQHDARRCVAYRARLSGQFLVVEATLEPGWHTFAMDNKQRAEEKLAGRKSLSSDQPTAIRLSDGLELASPWYQTPPADFSKPELRIFTWGFERQAVFVAKVRRTGTGAARLAIRGQACTDVTCKNIDVTVLVPLARKGSDRTEIDLKKLAPVRQ